MTPQEAVLTQATIAFFIWCFIVPIIIYYVTKD